MIISISSIQKIFQPRIPDIKTFFEVNMQELKIHLFLVLIGTTTVAPQISFTQDWDTDLSPQFKANSTIIASKTFSSNCFWSCVVYCNQLENCTSGTYSTNDNTCTLYTSRFCYGADTVTHHGVGLFRKVFGEFAFNELFCKTRVPRSN